MESAKNLDLAVDFGKATRVGSEGLSPYQLYSNLNTTISFPSHLDFAEFSFSERLAENILAKSRLLDPSFRLLLARPRRTVTAAILHAIAANQSRVTRLGTHVVGDMHWSRLSDTSSFPIEIVRWVVNHKAINNCAIFTWKICSHGWLANG